MAGDADFMKNYAIKITGVTPITTAINALKEKAGGDPNVLRNLIGEMQERYANDEQVPALAELAKELDVEDIIRQYEKETAAKKLEAELHQI